MNANAHPWTERVDAYPTHRPQCSWIAILIAWICVGPAPGLVFAQGTLGQPPQIEKPIPEVVRFNRDIRPILSDQCFHCHGPDKNTRQADLRLDTEEGLIGGDASTGAVIAGNPGESELFRRIISEDESERMPPPESHKEISVRDREVIRKWIEQGARYEGHWAFLPLQSFPEDEAPTSFANDSRVIDFFIERGMSQRGIEALPGADRITLIRRLYFDLLGLPPSPEEVRAFLEDGSSEAYRNLVDQLLASPHYGERMAMWWMDLVRYADTVGYHGDQEMKVSPFRDYLIASFNENKPFDQFTLEQLAGDLVENPSREDLIASGYNRLGMMSAEGGVQPKEYLAKYIAERVRNVSGTWLGITMGCAECHDHKFDPLTTREFYSMEAFFADIKERGLYPGGDWGSSIQVPSEEQERALAELNQKIEESEKTLQQSTELLEKAQVDWEKRQVQWEALGVAKATSASGTMLEAQEDGSILAKGENPATETYTLVVPETPAGLKALRLEVLPDDSLPARGPGRAGNGNFVLTELTVTLRRGDEAPVTVPIKEAFATYEQTGAAGGNPYGKWAVAAAIDGDAKGKKWGWAVMEQVGRNHFAVFHFDSNVEIKAGDSLEVQLHQGHDNPQHTIGRFRLTGTNQVVTPGALRPLPPEIGDIFAIPTEQRNEDQKAKLAVYYRSIAPELEPVRQGLAELKKQRDALVRQIPTTLVTEAVKPRMVRVLARGNWMDDSGEEVQPEFPAAIAVPSFQAAPERRLNRIDLAKWLTSPDHPLTSRVFVNRLWNNFFGEGLARNLDDLGAQGENPTHPELLDYLAGRFIRSGWNVKDLVRVIVLSDTYRRSSLAPDGLVEADRFNETYARQNRFRLDAEFVRDNALAISGLLVRDIGGSSVKPYQPPGYWAYLNFPTREWTNGRGSELYRRGMYTHWQRQYLHPSLLAFDAPNREECTAQRNRSNTPLQSLALLNDPTYVEAARAFAELILETSTEATPEARLELAFQRALSRSVEAAERDVLLQLLESAGVEYRANEELANSLLSVGQKPVPEGVQKVELAAWTAVTRAILNLHETITRN